MAYALSKSDRSFLNQMPEGVPIALLYIDNDRKFNDLLKEYIDTKGQSNQSKELLQKM